MADLICGYLRELSRQIDLSNLDGITVAYDYDGALRNLDRGREYSRSLTKSDGDVVGIAMTPHVWRDGVLKSHMVFNAPYLDPLKDPKSEFYWATVYTLAHEAAHVEITHVFNSMFPDLIGSKTDDIAHMLRWDAIRGCWDEYAACEISARWEDRSSVFEEAFLTAADKARNQGNDLIKLYRSHGEVSRIISELFAVYGNLAKLAGYLLGSVAGRQGKWQDLEKTSAALSGHWFRGHFIALEEALGKIMSGYGTWPDRDSFEQLGDVIERIVAEGGAHIHRRDGRCFYIEIPFSEETMP